MRQPLAVLFTLALSVLSCTGQGRSSYSKQDKNSLREGFIESFKTLSFCKCLEYSYSRALDLHKEDASCRYPDFLYGEQVYIDSLARLESARIVQDAASRAGRVAEGMEGKKVVATCLQFYQSKALSEFAHARYTLIEKEKGL